MATQTPYKAFKYFKKQFPAATLREVKALGGLLYCASTQNGVLRATLMQHMPPGACSLATFDAAVEGASHYGVSRDAVLGGFFGHNPEVKPALDPVALSDALNHDPRIAKMFDTLPAVSKTGKHPALRIVKKDRK